MNKTIKILFNGHDFKFLGPVFAHYENDPRYEVLFDRHPGHVITDTKKSAELLEQADVIFCEWALGNIEWYSHHKKSNQVLLVRLQHQELTLPYLERTDWDNVDSIIFMSHHNRDHFLERYPYMVDKSPLIYIPIDCDSFDKPKLDGAQFNLGFIGMSPKRKTPHIAFEIFERLKKMDRRYTLCFKGKKPWEYGWLWDRPGEQRYYEQFFTYMRQSEYGNTVVFDPHGPDVQEWFSKIGFLLSTSDHEGSHQSVAESMASGAIPVIRNWVGADLIYPPKYVFSTVDEAVGLITKWNSGDNYRVESEAAKATARERFDQSVIIPKMVQLIEDLLQSKTKSGAPVTVTEGSRSPGTNTGRRLTAMHVCYINPGTQGGYATRVIEETSVLVKAGIHTVIACFVHKSFFTSKDKLSEHVAFLRSHTGADVHLVAVDDFFDLSALSNGNEDIVSAIVDIGKHYNVDIIHCQALASAQHVMHANRQLKAKVIFDVHGISPEEAEMQGAHPARVNALVEWEKELLDAVDLNVFVSNHMKTHFEGRYQVVDPSHVVVPCCVHSEKFQMPEEDRLRKRLELGVNEKFVVSYLGTLSVWQWPEAMFSLFAQIYQKKRDSLFYLLLPEADHAKALQFIEKHNLPEESYILTEVPHEKVGSVLGIADVGVLLREPHPVNKVSSPTKFGEYMAAGVPVIATEDIGDTSDFVKLENLGLILSPSGDGVTSDDLVRMIEFIENVQKNRGLWSRRCSNFAGTKLDWAFYGTVLQESYDKLIADKRESY